jgi:hypothetical protein
MVAGSVATLLGPHVERLVADGQAGDGDVDSRDVDADLVQRPVSCF